MNCQPQQQGEEQPRSTIFPGSSIHTQKEQGEPRGWPQSQPPSRSGCSDVPAESSVPTPIPSPHTLVILGSVQRLLPLLACIQLLSGARQCCRSEQRFSDTHQPHSKRGSALRHSPQLSRRAEHLYRWAATAGRAPRSARPPQPQNGGTGRRAPAGGRGWEHRCLGGAWSQVGWGPGAHGAVFPPRSRPSLTLDVLRVVDDKVPVPDHGQVDRQVADVVPFVEILQEGTEGGRGRYRRGDTRQEVQGITTRMLPLDHEERDGEGRERSNRTDKASDTAQANQQAGLPKKKTNERNRGFLDRPKSR